MAPVRVVFAAACAIVCAIVPAQAQAPAPPAGGEEAAIVVGGEGSVSAAPDYAQITAGVTTRAKTAGEATDANAKAMTAVMAALAVAGIAKSDIQTVQFSVRPVYASSLSAGEQKVTGFAASNEVNVKVLKLDKLGEVLGRRHRCRQYFVPACQSVPGARPGAADRRRRRTPQGGDLRSRRGAEPRRRGVDHRGHRRRADVRQRAARRAGHGGRNADRDRRRHLAHPHHRRLHAGALVHPPPLARGKVRASVPVLAPHRVSSFVQGARRLRDQASLFAAHRSLVSSRNQKKRRGGTPANADPYPPHLAVPRASLRRAHLTAFHRGFDLRGYFIPKAQHQPRLPGTRSGRALPAFAGPGPGMHLPPRS